MSTGVASGSNLNFGDTNTNTESEPKSNKNRQLALLLGTLSDTFKGESDKTLQRIEFLDDREKKQEQNKLFDRTRARVAQSVKDGTLPATMLDLFDALGREGVPTFLLEEAKFRDRGQIGNLNELEFSLVRQYSSYVKTQQQKIDKQKQDGVPESQLAIILEPDQFFDKADALTFKNIYRTEDQLKGLINEVIRSGLGGDFEPDEPDEVEDI